MSGTLLFGPVFLFCISFGLLSSPYDRCNDILRAGIKDEQSRNNRIANQRSSHHQFGSNTSKNNSDERNFGSFANKRAKTYHGSSDSYGGSGSGWGVEIGYQQNNATQNLSEYGKMDLINANSKENNDYRDSNYGSEGYEESLQSEAIFLSKIANPVVVNAWRECMLGQTGFFADLIPSSSNMADDEIEYNAMIHWKSAENTEITSITLTYRVGSISVPYEVFKKNEDYVRTGNICDEEGCTLKSGSSLPLTILHKDRSRNGSITIIAKTNTGIIKSHTVILPKATLSKQIVRDSSADKNILVKHSQFEGYPKVTGKKIKFSKFVLEQRTITAPILRLANFEGAYIFPSCQFETEELELGTFAGATFIDGHGTKHKFNWHMLYLLEKRLKEYLEKNSTISAELILSAMLEKK